MAQSDVTRWFDDLEKIRQQMQDDNVGPPGNLHDFSLVDPNNFVQNNPKVKDDVNFLIENQIGNPVDAAWKQDTMRKLLDAVRKPIAEVYADLVYIIARKHCPSLPAGVGKPHLKDVLNELCGDKDFLIDVQAQVVACTEKTFTGAATAFNDGTLTISAAIEKVMK